jgi:NitT/TauT family transport system substrate-binding protein
MFTLTRPLSRLLRPAAAILCTALAISSASAQTAVKFSLDWRFEGPSAIVLLTAAKGYFKAEGLDVTIDTAPGSSAAVQRLATGTHDIGFADLSAVVEYLSKNPNSPKLQAIYVLMEQTPAVAVAMKKSGIKVPKDLNGKTLGAPIFDAGRKAFPLFAKAQGIDAKSINWKNVDPALRETLLAKGELDAITGFYYSAVLSLNARGVKDSEIVVFKYSDYGVNLYGNMVIASPKFISENPAAVGKFIKALNRGIKETIANPTAAIAYVKERDALIDVPLETKRLKYFLDLFVATPGAKAAGLGSVDISRIRANVAQISSAFELTNPVSTDALFNTSFLPPMADRKF